MKGLPKRIAREFGAIADPTVLARIEEFEYDHLTGCIAKPGRKRYTSMFCMPAHRFIYEACFGQIPDGEIVHHECRNKTCIRPAHLEAMTVAAHMARHCFDFMGRHGKAVSA